MIQLQRLQGPRAVAAAKHNVKMIALNFVILGSIWTVVDSWHKMSLLWHTVSAIFVLWAFVILATSVKPLFLSLLVWKRAAAGEEIEIVEPPHTPVMKTPWIVDAVVGTIFSVFLVFGIIFCLSFVFLSPPWYAKLILLTMGALLISLLLYTWKRVRSVRDDELRGAGGEWTKKAVQMVPPLQGVIIAEQNPTELWITLSYYFELAYETEPVDSRLIREIYAFAEWCLPSSEGELAEEEPNALKQGALSFYASAARSPLAGSDQINHVSQAANAELSRLSATVR